MTNFVAIAQAGDIAILRSGKRATIETVLHSPTTDNYPIEGIVDGSFESWTVDGRVYTHGTTGDDIASLERDGKPISVHLDKTGPLTYSTPDINGEVPMLELLGARKRHTGNGKIYTITGFSWNGATDEWNNIHVGPDGIPINRPLGHWTGNRDNGQPRYEEVSE